MVKHTVWRLSELTQELSNLKGFESNSVELEQVPTPITDAAQLLWSAFIHRDVQDKAVMDLGCGTGIFAIGAALLGARAVTAVDTDKKAIALAKGNAVLAGVKVAWITGGVETALGKQPDTVFMNPPFGVQTEGAIRPFLDTAITLIKPAGVLYMFAGPGSKRLIEKVALAQSIRVEEYQRYTWPYPAVFSHHVERRGEVTVDKWVLRSIRT